MLLNNIPEFFKFSETQEFYYYTWPHFIPIILMILVIYLIYRYREEIRNYKHEEWIRISLAMFVILMHFMYFWHYILIDTTFAYKNLPITVCGWAIIFSSFMLFTKKQTFFDIVYFFVLAGSFNALLTPAVLINAGPLRFRYYQFWIDHTFIFINVFYMIFVHKFRVTFKSFIVSFSALFILSLLALLVNANIEGANYLYLAGPLAQASILNVLPEALLPRYLVMGAIILTLYTIVYLPWYFMDRKKHS